MHRPTHPLGIVPATVLACAAVALLTAGGALARPAATAHTSAAAKFSGSICAVVNGKQIAKLLHVSAACTNVKSAKSPGGTIYYARFGKPGASFSTSRFLNVNVITPPSGMGAFFKSHFEKQTPGKAIKLGKGIEWAHEDVGSAGVAVYVYAHGVAAVVDLVDPKNGEKEVGAVVAIAKALGARL